MYKYFCAGVFSGHVFGLMSLKIRANPLVVKSYIEYMIYFAD